MLTKIKKFVIKNKKQVKLGIIIILAILLMIILYKTFFYSSAEKSIYGVRLRDIKEHEITSKDIKELDKKSSSIEGISNVDIVIKGRLIKFFVTFDDDISTDDMKTKFTSMLDYLSEDIKSYYDVTFYAEQIKDKETKYPVIGYKHKTATEITWDVF